MLINFDTDRLIAIHYPPGAGGKLLASMLAVSESVLHSNPVFCKNKFDLGWDEKTSHKASKVLIDMSVKKKRHVENDHGATTFGITYADDIDSQKLKANEMFRTLTNQDKFFFTMTNHEKFVNFSHYRHCNHIVLKDCDKILEVRKASHKKVSWMKEFENQNLSNQCFFDMDHIFHEDQFKEQFKELLSKLSIEVKNYDYVDDLRKGAIDTIGYASTFDASSHEGKGWFN